MRCFVAVELEPALRDPLIRLLHEKLPRSRDVRWCTDNQLHITLKFLGEVSDAQLPDVCDTVAAACAHVPPFRICLSGLGCFPNPTGARVLWCGIDDPDEGCARWLAAADQPLAGLGFERETRPYHPHITLGRSKSRGGTAVIRRVLETVSPPPPQEMTVRHVVLFESQLGPSGARYAAVAKTPLGG